MNTLKDYVNFRLTHADKFASAEAYPLTMENCKKYKPMRDLKVYGNSVQDGTPTPETPVEIQSVGDLVTDETDINYGKYKIPVVVRGINYFSMAKTNATTKTINGLTFTPLGDERVHIKGKVEDTSKSTLYTININNKVLPIPKGKYTIKDNGYSYETLELLSWISNGSTGLNIFAANNNLTEITTNSFISAITIHIPANSKKEEFDDIIHIQIERDKKNSPYEPYVEPVTTNVFINEPLGNGEYIDFKNKKVVRDMSNEVIECQLPTLISKTSIIEVDTSLAPSNIYGKYIKK